MEGSSGSSSEDSVDRVMEISTGKRQRFLGDTDLDYIPNEEEEEEENEEVSENNITHVCHFVNVPSSSVLFPLIESSTAKCSTAILCRRGNSFSNWSHFVVYKENKGREKEAEQAT